MSITANVHVLHKICHFFPEIFNLQLQKTIKVYLGTDEIAIKSVGKRIMKNIPLYIGFIYRTNICFRPESAVYSSNRRF